MDYIKYQNIPITGVNLVGDNSTNKVLKEAIEVRLAQYDLPLAVSPPEISTNNGVITAWTAWELKNAKQDVDIANSKVWGHKQIPLGSFMTDSIDRKKQKTLTKFNRMNVVRNEFK